MLGPRQPTIITQHIAILPLILGLNQLDVCLYVVGSPVSVYGPCVHVLLSALPGTLPSFWNVLLWVAVGVFTTLLPVLPKPWGIVLFLVSLILRSIYTMGLGPALLMLGAANVSVEA